MHINSSRIYIRTEIDPKGNRDDFLCVYFPFSVSIGSVSGQMWRNPIIELNKNAMCIMSLILLLLSNYSSF